MKIGVIGLGLIGGCLGLDLRQAGHQVYGVSRRQQTCQKAVELGVVDQASVTLADLTGVDVAIVCTPINLLVPIVADLASILPSEVVITDVGSVKGTIVGAATHLWPRFVGGHPMAGKAESGITAAEHSLFRDRPYVITPIEKTDADAVEWVVEIATTLNAQVHFADPKDHDRAVAWISHLPVMVSASLIQACLQESNTTVQDLAQKLASSGFRDTSRVGGGNPDLGLMMAQNNRDALLTSLQSYRYQLERLTAAIETENWQTLSQLLTQTHQGRRDFNNG